MGLIVLMSDYRKFEIQTAAEIMTLFWCTHDASHEHLALQTWGNGEWVLHLDTNERSGADTWFGGVLDACKSGALTEVEYNFLHGYPTKECIRVLVPPAQ